MSPHTPGPWKTGTPGRGRFCVYSAAAHGRGVCVMSNTQRISEWEREKYGEHGDNLEADANAALIAAAPDMLDALRDLVAWSEMMGEWESPAWRAAESAIAKAEGVTL